MTRSCLQGSKPAVQLHAGGLVAVRVGSQGRGGQEGAEEAGGDPQGCLAAQDARVPGARGAGQAASLPCMALCGDHWSRPEVGYRKTGGARAALPCSKCRRADPAAQGCPLSPPGLLCQLLPIKGSCRQVPCCLAHGQGPTHQPTASHSPASGDRSLAPLVHHPM